MPKFEFNKLVRDGLRKEYEDKGQRAEYIELSPIELKRQLARKALEEAKELVELVSQDGLENIESITEEIGDIKQSIMDLMEVYSIDENQVEKARLEKFERKGGFSGGTFVSTLELNEDDEWAEYYRSQPDIYREVKKQ